MIERDEEHRDTRVVGVAMVVGLGVVLMMVIWALAGGFALSGFLALGAALSLPTLTYAVVALTHPALQRERVDRRDESPESSWGLWHE